MTAPTYHDVHVTTPTIARTSIFNLPFGFSLTCTRSSGWELWTPTGVVAGEYGNPHKGLVIDVDGHVICDSLNRQPEGPTDA